MVPIVPICYPLLSSDIMALYTPYPNATYPLYTLAHEEFAAQCTFYSYVGPEHKKYVGKTSAIFTFGILSQ